MGAIIGVVLAVVVALIVWGLVKAILWTMVALAIKVALIALFFWVVYAVFKAMSRQKSVL